MNHEGGFAPVGDPGYFVLRQRFYSMLLFKLCYSFISFLDEVKQNSIKFILILTLTCTAFITFGQKKRLVNNLYKEIYLLNQFLQLRITKALHLRIILLIISLKLPLLLLLLELVFCLMSIL